MFGHCGNLGNECADHAAALVTFGLTSNQNVITRWNRPNLEAVACVDGCDTFHEILERLQRIRMEVVSFLSWNLSSLVFIIGFFLCFVALSFSFFWCCCFEQATDRHYSSATPLPSLNDDFEQVCCILASKLDYIDLARVALTCHIALDLLLLQGGGS